MCSSCGLVFAKWAQRVLGQERIPRSASSELESEAESDSPSLAAIFLPATERVDPIAFYGRCALYVAFLVWGIYFISLDLRSNEIGESFLHRVNLVFHEAGHVVFMPFGHFMMVLGGTLGQLLMPAIAGIVLLLKTRDAFGASIALWWLGQSVMDVAPYINDARDLDLMLLGGGTGRDRPGMHDWENILLDLGLIEHERALALGADRLGTLLLVAGLAWGAALLYRQYGGLKHGAGGG
ncbi:MAG: zinc ribbon domain-containing protein [Betaproteobacteria bacterium]|nr:zinc ribbon domain-containing protein [Betaproteobacteria bacterium]